MEEIMKLWGIPVVVGIITALLAAGIIRLLKGEPKIMIGIAFLFLLAGIVGTKIIYNPLVKVPNVVNKSQDEAKVIIEKKKLICSITEEWNDRIPKYRVISQDPEAGIPVYKNSIVKISLSKGSKPQEVEKAKPIKEDEVKKERQREILPEKEVEIIQAKPLPPSKEITLLLSQAPVSWGKRIHRSSGKVIYLDNFQGAFSGRIELKGLESNHNYVLSINGKPSHPSNDKLPESYGIERYVDFLQVITNSAGDIDSEDFNVKLPSGDYNVKFFVKDPDDWKIVLYNDFVMFTVK